MMRDDALDRTAYQHDDPFQLPVIEPEPWTAQALCGQANPDAWFPEKGASPRDAKRICATCPVAADCLEYAMRNRERWGVWGGLTERERRQLERAA